MKLMWRRPSAAGLSEGNEAVCRFALSGASCTPDAPAGSSANTAQRLGDDRPTTEGGAAAG